MGGPRPAGIRRRAVPADHQTVVAGEAMGRHLRLVGRACCGTRGPRSRRWTHGGDRESRLSSPAPRVAASVRRLDRVGEQPRWCRSPPRPARRGGWTRRLRAYAGMFVLAESGSASFILMGFEAASIAASRRRIHTGLPRHSTASLCPVRDHRCRPDRRSCGARAFRGRQRFDQRNGHRPRHPHPGRRRRVSMRGARRVVRHAGATPRSVTQP